MDIEKEREAFEEWAKANGYHVAKNPIGEVYLSLNCNNAWKAWQAAKEHEANKLGQETLTHYRLQELIAIGVKAALDEREQK